MANKKLTDETDKYSPPGWANVIRLLSDWTWEIDHELCIKEVSDAFYSTLEFLPAEIVGKNFIDLFSSEAIEDGDSGDFFREPFKEIPFHITASNGDELFFSVSGAPLFDPDNNKFAGACGIAVDITSEIDADFTLRESEARYRTLIETSPTAIVVHQNFRVQFANKSALELFGAKSEQDLLGKTSLELTHADFHDLINQRRVEVENNLRPLDPAEVVHKRLNGELFYASDTAAPVIWDGEPSVLVTMVDISTVKEAEIALAKSEQRFRDFAESAADIFWETDENHRYTFVTPPSSQTDNFDFDLIRGKKRWELEILERDNQVWQQHKTDLKAHRPFKNFRYSFKNPNGNLMYLRGSGRPVFSEDNVFLGYRGATVDETAEIIAQQDAESLHDRFFTAIENISEGFAMWDAEENFLFCNSYFMDAHPEGQEFLEPGKKYADFIRKLGEHGKRPKSKEHIEAWIEERLESFRHPSSIHVDHLGDTWMQIRKHKLEDGSTIVLFADITETKIREEKLKATEDRISLITDAIPALVAYNDKNLKFQFANKHFETIGLDPEKLIGMTYAEIFGGDVYDRIKPHLDQALKGEIVTYENTLSLPDGKILNTQVTITPDIDENGEVVGLFALSMDITQLKETTDLLRENQIRLDNAQRIANIGSWERDLVADTVNWSDENYSIYGFDEKKDNITYQDFLAAIHPDDAERHSKNMAECLKKGYARFSSEFRIIRGDGAERVIRGDGEVTYNSKKEPIKISGTAQDITAQKRNHDALEDAKRLAEYANRAKSEFLSSMSHELRTPMNAILGYAQLLLQNKKELLSERQTKQVNQVLKSGHHLLKLINDILDLSRIESGNIALEYDEIAPETIIEESVSLIQSFADRYEIEIKIDTGNTVLPKIQSDSTRLKQALLNLLSNAIKYNNPGGDITVSCQVSSPGYFRFSVADTGIGISEEQMSGIFDPFNRLGIEEQGIEGTGIGLTITRQLVELMGGRIDFESIVGLGSNFWFELPATQRNQSKEHVDNDNLKSSLVMQDHFNSGVFKILYVEDDESNLNLLEEVFSHYPNLSLISVRTAESGVKIAREKLPDLILMDINLPGMSGYDALEQLGEDEKTNSIPVIALSAAALQIDVNRGLEAGFHEYLTKPFEIEEVLNTIEETLKGAPPKNTLGNLAE